MTSALEKHLRLQLLINEKYTLSSDVKLPYLVYTLNFPKSGSSLTEFEDITEVSQNEDSNTILPQKN